MPSRTRTQLYQDFMKILTTEVDSENKKRGFGYGSELGDSENPASNAAFIDFLNAGAITDHNGKRLPGRRSRTENDRINSIGGMLESGKAFYVYRKGEEYPREVYFDPKTEKIMVSKLTVDKMKNRKPAQPDGGDRLLAFFGNQKKKEMVANWDKYTQRSTVRKNVRDSKRIDRRRRNDTALYRSIRGRAVNNSDSDTYESLMTSLKADLGYEKNFRDKGNSALKDILENGSILDHRGRHINVPGKGTPEDMTYWLGKRMFEYHTPVYVFKPGETSPHEVYLGSDNTIMVSDRTVDKMDTDAPEPRWYHRFAHFFTGRNETVINFARAMYRKRMMENGFDLPKDTKLPEEKKEAPAEKKNDEPQKAAEVEKDLNAPQTGNNEIKKEDIEVETAVIQPVQPANNGPVQQPVQSEADKLNEKYDTIFADFKAGKITLEEMNRQLEAVKNPQPEIKAGEKAENKPELLNATLNSGGPVPQKDVQPAEAGLISDLFKTIENMQKQMAEMEKSMSAAIVANIEAQKKLEQSIDTQLKIQSEAAKDNAKIEAKAVEAVMADMQKNGNKPEFEPPKPGTFKFPEGTDKKKVINGLFGDGKAKVNISVKNQPKVEAAAAVVPKGGNKPEFEPPKPGTFKFPEGTDKKKVINGLFGDGKAKVNINVKAASAEKKPGVPAAEEPLLAKLNETKAKMAKVSEELHKDEKPKLKVHKPAAKQKETAAVQDPKAPTNAAAANTAPAFTNLKKTKSAYNLKLLQKKLQLKMLKLSLDQQVPEKKEQEKEGSLLDKLSETKAKMAKVSEELHKDEKPEVKQEQPKPAELKEEQPEQKKPENAPGQSKNGPVIGTGTGVQYDPVNRQYVRFDKSGLSPQEELIARTKIIKGGRELTPEETLAVTNTADQAAARANEKNQAECEEPCTLIENVVKSNGEKAVSAQLCDNVFKMHKNAMDSKAVIQKKCDYGERFVGGKDVKNIVNYNNMKLDLGSAGIADSTVRNYSNPAYISFVTEMSNASPNMKYASNSKRDPLFFKNTLLDEDGLNSLTEKYNADISKALDATAAKLSAPNKKLTQEDVFTQALEKKAEQKKQGSVGLATAISKSGYKLNPNADHVLTDEEFEGIAPA